jgi:hypothetical protein
VVLALDERFTIAPIGTGRKRVGRLNNTEDLLGSALGQDVSGHN